jgi:hypothetical protein
MRALLAGVLAATLVGCTSVPRLETGAARKPVASKVAVKNAKSIKSKTRAVAKLERSRTTGLPPAKQPKMADQVIEKAKATISSMLEVPASAEFYNIKRARRNLLDRTMDSICGYVRTEAGDNAGMPFLYIIGQNGDDEAYLVDGISHVSETVHRAVCK